MKYLQEPEVKVHVHVCPACGEQTLGQDHCNWCDIDEEYDWTGRE